MSASFGPFRYDAAQHALFRDGRPVPLEPKVAETLEALLERRGEVVEKAELIRRVWPDCSVEEVGLARNISLLRKALDDSAGEYIETIPKRGYRFAAAQRPPRRWRVWPTAILLVAAAFVYWQFYLPSRYLPQLGRAAVVAVIPPVAADPLAQPLHDGLVAELSPAVQLISPSTVNRYQQLRIPTPLMTRLLGVEVVIEASIERQDGRVRAAYRMSDVRSGKLIWSKVYDEEPDRATSEIPRAVSAEVASRLTR